jgi:hypothetical protein
MLRKPITIFVGVLSIFVAILAVTNIDVRIAAKPPGVK